jgi:SAM-dependent methyltransferase
VSAGAAARSLAIARRNTRCRVTALDLGAALAVTRPAVATAGQADRFDDISGDVFDVPLPLATYDLVLLGNLCHLFDGPANLRLFRRLRPAIQEGGRIAVIDVMPSQDPAAERSVRLSATGLMTAPAARACTARSRIERGWKGPGSAISVSPRRAGSRRRPS